MFLYTFVKHVVDIRVAILQFELGLRQYGVYKRKKKTHMKLRTDVRI